MFDYIFPKKQNGEQPETAEKPKKKYLRWILLIAAVLIVALIVCIFAFPRVFNPDRIGRYFRYFGVSPEEGYGRIRFDSNSTDSYAVFQDRFAVGCEDGMYLFDDYGEQIALVQGSLPYPKICACDSLALCWSNESSTLVALNKKGETVLETAANGTVLDCELSDDGCICYAASNAGSKTQVTVMDREFREIYKWKSYSRYLNCCALSQKAERLAVVGLNQTDGVFSSTLSILRTDSEDDAVIAEADLGNQIIYELWFLNDDRICAVGEANTSVFTVDGKCLQTYDYAGKTLTDFAKNKNGTLYLSFDCNKAGLISLLVSMNADGEIISEREFAGEIQSISVNGKYLAVLTDQNMTVFDDKLEVYSETQEQTAANRALARKDGTVLLVSNGQTTLYIP